MGCNLLQQKKSFECGWMYFYFLFARVITWHLRGNQITPLNGLTLQNLQVTSGGCVEGCYCFIGEICASYGFIGDLFKPIVSDSSLSGRISYGQFWL